MRPTRTISGKKARAAIHKGVNAIYQPVRVTFGPEGKNALLYRTNGRGNRITNDGVTVAECQEPKDQFIRMAAQTFKESCKRTNERVGDGTTCTTILAGKLFNEIYALTDETENVFVQNQRGVMSLKREIIAAADIVKEALTKQSKEIKSLEDLEKIAIVSVEDEELGKTIAKMAWDCGVDGFIDVVEGYKGKIETETIKGMRFPAKVPSQIFVNNPARFEMVVEDCPIIITNFKLDNTGDIAGSLNDIQKTTSKLIVIAPSFSDNVLVNFVNAAKQGYFIHPIKAPSLRTEQFEDLALYCGAAFINKQEGKKLQNIKAEDLGFIERIVVKDTAGRDDAIVTGGRGALSLKVVDRDDLTGESAVEKRLSVLKGQLEETKEIPFKKLLERRIASMASAVGVIKVGGSTKASSLYSKLKIEDAVYACKAALKGGYVKGGGVALKEISEKLPEDNILKNVILAPYEQIQSSFDGEFKITKDIIDPTEAIYYAIEHATEVVANLITVDSLTVEMEQAAPEEGTHAIAKVLLEMAISDKINKGQLKEGEAEAYRDSLNGMNEWEYEVSNDD